MKQFLEAGKAVTTHGVYGELKFYPWCDSVQTLKKVKYLFLDENGTRSFEVESVKEQKNMNIIKLQGIDSLEEARKFIDKVFYVSREEIRLPKGSFFVADLIGIGVYDADTGEHYGKIIDVTDNGAHDIYHVELESGEVRLIPAVKPFIVTTDTAKERLEIRPIKGMMSDED